MEEYFYRNLAILYFLRHEHSTLAKLLAVTLSHIMTFEQLGLCPPLLQAVKELGFEEPSKIQSLAIPKVIEGRDIVGLSATGSGKTAAFTLPALQMVDRSFRKPQVLILSPTRELCVQVCEEVGRLGKYMNGVTAIPLYGGAPIERQIKGLRQGAQIIVGTPGRLFDHLRRGTLDPANISLCILDEADRMLDMGFRDEMEELLSQLPADLQTLFFSATMNKHVEKLIHRFGNSPEEISVEAKTKTVDSIDQSYYEVRNRSKIEVLSRLLDIEPPRLAVIFCNTKRSVDECTEALLARGYSADRLHGDITQQLRERVINRFREGKIELLVATDVAGRGLDIEDVEMVFNYDLPQDPEDYVHRIGRTGRAGRSGRAVSFVFGKDVYRLQNVERYTRQKIRRERIPSQEIVEGKRADKLFDSLRDKLEKSPDTAYSEYIDRLLGAGYAATDIASTLFGILRESIGREGEEIIEDTEGDKPQRNRRERGERKERSGNDRRDRRDRKGKYADKFDDDKDFKKRSRNKDGEPPRIEKGMTQLYLSLGSKMGCRPGDIVGMLYSETSVGNGNVGRIRMFPKHCLVQVPEKNAQKVINELKGSRLKGKPFIIRLDKDL